MIADLNGDGILDIGISNTNSFGVYLGNGDATYQIATDWFGLGPYPGDTLALNLHGQNPASGRPDILVTDGGGSLLVLFNTGK